MRFDALRIRDDIESVKKRWEKTRESNSPTVLILDDSASVRNTLTMLLKMHGYRVLSAEDGLEGIKIFKEHIDCIQLVISDIDMPYMDGIRTFLAMKQFKASQKIIFMSGCFPEEINDIAGCLEVKNIVHKPFDLKRMLKIVREAVDAQ